MQNFNLNAARRLQSGGYWGIIDISFIQKQYLNGKEDYI